MVQDGGLNVEGVSGGAVAVCYPMASSPRKMRLVADMIRGKNIRVAVNLLRFSKRKAAGLLYKVLQSAVANAQCMAMDLDVLYVGEIIVDASRVLRRMRARAMGRGCRVRKCYSRVKIRLLGEV